MGATFVLQGVGDANGDSLLSGDEDVTDAAYSADLEFEKAFGDFGTAFLHLETGDGAGAGRGAGTQEPARAGLRIGRVPGAWPGRPRHGKEGPRARGGPAS